MPFADCVYCRSRFCEHLPDPRWLKPAYGYPAGQGVYSCGESFPVMAVGRDNVESQENRRVELVFAPKDLQLKGVSSKNVNMKAGDCAVYNREIVQLVSVVVLRNGPSVFGKICMSFIDLLDKPIKGIAVELRLPGMANPLHILFLPDTDETFSNIHQVGVKVQDDKGEWVGLLLLHSVMGISPYKKMGHGGMLNHFALQIPMYAPVQDIIPENDSYWKKQQHEMEQQVERYSKNLKEYVDQLLEDPDSPFLVDLTRIREYRELASEMEKVCIIPISRSITVS